MVVMIKVIMVIQVAAMVTMMRSEEHTSELQSRQYRVCRLLLEKKKKRQQRKKISAKDKKEKNDMSVEK